MIIINIFFDLLLNYQLIIRNILEFFLFRKNKNYEHFLRLWAKVKIGRLLTLNAKHLKA